MIKAGIGTTVSTVLMILGSHAQAHPALDMNDHSQDAPWFLGLGFTAGGEDLLEVTFDDGPTQTLEAGGLMDMKAGFIYAFPETNIELQSSIGYYIDSLNADNGDAYFHRVPLELLGFYRQGSHRFGLGLSYHLRPELTVDFGFSEGHLEFESSAGFVAEYGCSFNEQFMLGVRAVSIDYRLQEGSNVTIDGDHIGLYGYVTF